LPDSFCKLKNAFCRLENAIFQSVYSICHSVYRLVLLTFDHVRSPDGVCQSPDDF
jgi:hypothetical protein